MFNDEDETTIVDVDAKCRVNLARLEDSNQNPYWIGKLQMPGTIDFEDGVSFMVYVSDEGYEEVQIAPVDAARRSKKPRKEYESARFGNARLKIEMRAHTDKNGKVFYVGELYCPASVSLKKGIFFSFFNSKEGREELQISRMKASDKSRPKYTVSEMSEEPQAIAV